MSGTLVSSWNWLRPCLSGWLTWWGSCYETGEFEFTSEKTPADGGCNQMAFHRDRSWRQHFSTCTPMTSLLHPPGSSYMQMTSAAAARQNPLRNSKRHSRKTWMPLLSTAGNDAYNPALLRQCRVFSTCTTPMPTGRSTSGWMVNHWNVRRSQCTLVWPWTDHWRTTTTSWKLRQRFGRGTTSSAGWLARRGVHRRRHSGRLPWHCVFQWQSTAHRSGAVVPTLTWSTSSWTRRWGRSREPCVPLHYRGSQSSVTSFQPSFAARRRSPGWSGRFRQIRISHLSRTYSTLQEYVFCPGTLCGWRYLAQSSLPCPPGKKIGRIKLSGTVSLSRTHRFALLGLIWCAQIGSHSTATALVMAGVRRASTSGASRTIHSAPVAASRRCPTLSTSVRWRNSTVASGLSTALTAKQLSGFAREAHAKKREWIMHIVYLSDEVSSSIHPIRNYLHTLVFR